MYENNNKTNNELKDALGLGSNEDMFEIDGKKYPISRGITLEEQENFVEMLGGFVPKSFYVLRDATKKETYYKVLARAFDDKVSIERLKKMKVEDAAEAIMRFLGA